jgi:general secretion pathway protein A
MYLRHFGLRELPFELTPNPRFLFMTTQHREALANLQYGLSTAKAVTLLIGEAGTGKTTLLRAALESETCRHVRCVHLTNPGLSRDEFIETLARAFGLSEAAFTSKASLLSELEIELKARRARGETTALVVDEAQRLTPELLEEIRLLANIETDTEKLLPLVLAGQPELAARLNENDMRQLKQRVALRCEIKPLALGDTAAYIANRIRTAGGESARLFTREAVVLIQDYSQGIPRTISVICDNALLNGFAAGRQPVGRDIIEEVVKDFDLRRVSAAAPQEPPPAPVIVVERPVPRERPLPEPLITASAAVPAAPVDEAARATFSDAAKSRRFSLFGRS